MGFIKKWLEYIDVLNIEETKFLQMIQIGEHILTALLAMLLVAAGSLWLWRRGRSEESNECLHQLQHWAPRFQATPLRKMEETYIDIVLERFQPKEYQKVGRTLGVTRSETDRLWLPTLDGEGHYLFQSRESGALYSLEDVYWVETLLFVGRQFLDSKRQKKLGVREERQRIRRDLHDELTQDLIALLRSAKDDAQSRLAGDAMNSLKNILSALSDDENELQVFLTACQAQMRERLLMHETKLEWFEKNINPETVLSAVEVSNLLKVMKESVSNITKHAAPCSVKVVVNQHGELLTIRIENSLSASNEIVESNELGMRNMHIRMRELNGNMDVRSDQASFAVVFSVPLENERES